MSGGSDTQTTSAVPEWAVPAAQSYLQRSQQVADLPYQGYEGSTVAQMNPYQQAGTDAIAQRAMQGSPVSDAASRNITSTLNGDYLNNNPWLDATVQRAQGDVKQGLAGIEARSGSFGNSGVQQTTARQLGDVSAQIRGADYGAERGRQMQAIGLAPSIANQDYTDAQQLIGAGDKLQGQDQRNLTDAYQRFQEARDYPKDQLATLGKGLGMNYGSSTTGGSGNGLAQGLGAALATYGAYKGYGGGSTSTGGGK